MDFKKIRYEVVILIWNRRNFTNHWPEVNSAFSYFQFFSTLFAPLGFFADKMESFMPSSFWHQLTRIWPRLTQTQCIHTHTHTNTTPNPWTKSVFSPVFSITAHLLHCYWLPYVGWSCINTVILLLRCSPTLFQ